MRSVLSCACAAENPVNTVKSRAQMAMDAWRLVLLGKDMYADWFRCYLTRFYSANINERIATYSNLAQS
jgi:hypothetical protein